jgi:hypothetical protein
MIAAATNEKENIPYPLLPKYLAASIWIPNAISLVKTSALNNQAEFFTKRIAVLLISEAINISFSSANQVMASNRLNNFNLIFKSVVLA